VFNWLFARHHGGQFILRIEDTDESRSRPEFTQNILDGLQWLGLNWDEGPLFQSKRLDLYREAIQKLLEQGLAYRAYDTPAELEAMRAAQQARKQAPRYDNRHRDLTPEQQAAFEAEGRDAVIRFKIDDNREIIWNDLVRGTMTWKGADLGGDMVIARAASGGQIGQPLYNLAVVVDDMDMAITHVIRGEDHIANTAKQILLYEAFGAKVPEFAHTPLILNQSGQKLSKRDGVTSITEYQKLGFTAEALTNYMTLLGWSPPDSTQERFTLDQAAQEFSFDRVNKAGAKFDWDKLDWLNSQYLHEKPPAELLELVAPYWQEAGYEFDLERDRTWLEPLAALIGPSLTRLPDAVDLGRFYFTPTLDFSEAATQQLQQEGAATVVQAVHDAIAGGAPLDSKNNAQTIIKQVVKEHDLKKGLVMRTLRAAFMADMQGPDLVESWLILHQRGFDLPRLEAALSVAQG
jgi:glutamyl-tRNA synthetase